MLKDPKKIKNKIKASNAWQKARPGYSAAANRRYRIKHPAAYKASKARCLKKYFGKYYAKEQAWRKANPKKVQLYQQRSNAKVRSTSQGQLSAKMSSRICLSLQNKKKNQRWLELADFTLEQLKRHIEKRFAEGMSWKLYMKGQIHIDHKIPVSAFNFATPADIDFKKCWSLKNLQPMWSHENQSKNDKLIKPFQPSLLLKL